MPGLFLSNVMTSEELQLMPEFLVEKLGEEIGLYEAQMRSRATELEKKIELHEDVAGELNKMIVKQEMQLREARGAVASLEEDCRGYVREIDVLNGEVAGCRDRIRGLEEQRSAGSDAREMDALKKKVQDLERENRKLAARTVDQKNQISYLLKRGRPDDARGLEMVRLIHRLSGRMEESGDESVSYSRLVDEILAEREDFGRMQAELGELRRNGYALEVEYNRVFGERGEMLAQLSAANEEKKRLQRHSEEMREELMYLKIDLGNAKTKNSLLTDASAKLVEMNSELVRSSVVIRESKAKIGELKTQLAESEERYNRYILEDRTNVTALLGREMEGIKKKLEGDFRVVHDLENGLKNALDEQRKVKSMQRGYEEKVVELERRVRVMGENEKKILGDVRRYRSGNQRYRNLLMELGEETRSVCGWVEELMNDLEGVFGLLNGTVELERGRRRSIEELGGEIAWMGDALEERDRALQSLIENRGEDAVALLGKERGILRQENIFLRNRIESLGDSADFVEKIGRLEDENEALRTRCNAMEGTCVSERNVHSEQVRELEELRLRCRQLQTDVEEKAESCGDLRSEIGVLRDAVENSRGVIEKYKMVVERLRIIKDAYLKLRDGGEESCVETKAEVEAEAQIEPVQEEAKRERMRHGEDARLRRKRWGHEKKRDRRA